MAGTVDGGVRVTQFAALMLGLALGGAAQPAMAANCPRPDALGISRTLVVDARQHPLIGSMQYRETLPLNDGEVVLTFDDGPLPKYTNQILDILAAQCVKATFFLVGRQAQANPEGVRRVLAGGHTIASHSQNHPMGMHRLPVDRAKAEIDDGIASITTALGDNAAAMSPFFRIPGLARNDEIEDYTRSKGLQIWSADFPADDWRPVSSKRVYDLALQRLAAKGKGILLLHDIQPRTVAALPKFWPDIRHRIWLGTSIENNDYVHRADHLRARAIALPAGAVTLDAGALPFIELLALRHALGSGGHRILERLGAGQFLLGHARRQGIAFRRRSRNRGQ